MKINLAFKERLVLSGILPEKNDIRTMTIAEDIRKKIVFTQDEIKDAEFRVENNQYLWNPGKAQDSEITFSDAESDLIKERFQELDKEKAITQDVLSLYRLFKA